jgi:hypothetical protein
MACSVSRDDFQRILIVNALQRDSRNGLCRRPLYQLDQQMLVGNTLGGGAGDLSMTGRQRHVRQERLRVDILQRPQTIVLFLFVLCSQGKRFLLRSMVWKPSSGGKDGWPPTGAPALGGGFRVSTWTGAFPRWRAARLARDDRNVRDAV